MKSSKQKHKNTRTTYLFDLSIYSAQDKPLEKKTEIFRRTNYFSENFRTLSDYV